MLRLILASCLLSNAIHSFGSVDESYRFAGGFQTAQIVSDASAREQFVSRYLKSVAPFHSPNVCYDPVTGMSLDGLPFEFSSGKPLPARRYSAASKEALHLNVLSLAISGNQRASLFLSPADPAAAPQLAKRILTAKLATYERFDSEYPGFAGSLPWFVVAGDRIQPAAGWQQKTPVLDNGQWAWALVHTESVLRKHDEPVLADRAKARWEKLASNFERVFCEAQFLRGVAGIADPALAPEDPAQRYVWVPSPGDLDPYQAGGVDESELALLFGVAFAPWSEPQIPETLLASRRLNQALGRKKAVGRTKYGPIAVQRGFWFSAHEVWPVLQFPYLDDPLIRRVFENGERFRTRYSADHSIPGLMASAHEPIGQDGEPRYISGFGIPADGDESPSFATNIRTDVVSPYASFPVILANEPIGLAFLHTMLMVGRTETPFGVAESVAVTGDKVSTIVTVDGNMTIVLALAINEEYRTHGEHFLAGALKAAGKYTDLRGTLRNDYVHAFPTLAETTPTLEGESIPFGTPTASAPKVVAEASPKSEPEEVVPVVAPVEATPSEAAPTNLLVPTEDAAKAASL